jgi:Flp pilus assembly protein CpaB
MRPLANDRFAAVSSAPSILTREAGTSSAAARKPRKRPALAHILIALAAVLAFGLNYLALQTRDAIVIVAVADSDFDAGSTVRTSAFRLEEVDADLPGIDGLLAEADIGSVDGWIVQHAMPEGSLVPMSALVPPATHAGLRLMSIPVTAEHAAGASITAGDRIDVISVVEGVPGFVAEALEVISVSDSDQGALSVGTGYFVVVAVDPGQALALAVAIDSGSLDLVRSTGAEAIGPGEG